MLLYLQDRGGGSGGGGGGGVGSSGGGGGEVVEVTSVVGEGSDTEPDTTVSSGGICQDTAEEGGSQHPARRPMSAFLLFCKKHRKQVRTPALLQEAQNAGLLFCKKHRMQVCSSARSTECRYALLLFCKMH